MINLFIYRENLLLGEVIIVNEDNKIGISHRGIDLIYAFTTRMVTIHFY